MSKFLPPKYDTSEVNELWNETNEVFEAINQEFLPPEATIWVNSIKKIYRNFDYSIETMNAGYTTAAMPETIYKILKRFNLSLQEFLCLILDNYPLPPKFRKEMEMPEFLKRPPRLNELQGGTSYFFNPDNYGRDY